MPPRSFAGPSGGDAAAQAMAEQAQTTADAAMAGVSAARSEISPALAASLADRADLHRQVDGLSASLAGKADTGHSHSGFAAAGHTHGVGDVTGTVPLTQLPTGTSGATVALGNHGHSGYAASAHQHATTDLTGSVPYGQLPTGTAANTVAAGDHAHAGYLAAVHQTSASTPAILLGGSADVTLTWPTAFPSTAYTVEFTKGPGLLGSSSVALKSKTTTGCVATITATLAISLGSILFAQGYM
jgi:hypothetical protein